MFLHCSGAVQWLGQWRPAAACSGVVRAWHRCDSQCDSRCDSQWKCSLFGTKIN